MSGKVLVTTLMLVLSLLQPSNSMISSFRVAARTRANRGVHQGTTTNCLGNTLRMISSSIPNNNNDDVVSNGYDKTYRLDGIGHRSKVEITTNSGHELTTDVPHKMGGTDTAPQPVETLLASWMGCTQATAVFVGRQLSPRIVIESLVFEGIEAVRDERGALALPIEQTPSIPSRLRRISGRIRVFTRAKTQQLSKDQLELLREQTEIRCPIANMILASGCAMDVEWVDASSTTVAT